MTDAFKIFAAAGLAEAAWAMALMFAWAVILLIGALSLTGFLLRSWRVAAVALAIAAMFTVFCMPWQAFAPVEPHVYDDPDVQDWIPEFKLMAYGWLAAVIASVSSLAFASLLGK